MASYTPELGSSPAPPPPLPPPKPGSHEVSGISTPVNASFPPDSGGRRQIPTYVAPPTTDIPDPGEGWLPQMLQDKSKQDIAAILANPTLIQALTSSPSTIHPSLKTSHTALQTALTENIELANHITDLESRLSHLRASTQAQLLSTHALERQWRGKQSDMDHALGPFAPASLYQRLGQGVVEQSGICQAMEESFLDGGGGDGGDEVSEREVGEWVRRYREARVLYYLRQERKERWDEGRVGGWR